MPRLLIVATVPVTFEAFLAPFADHFRSLGWRVDGMASDLSSSPAAARFDEVFDVTWSRNPLDVGGISRAVGQVRAIVAQGGYDIVHVHTPVAAFVTRFALRRSRRVRVVYTAHGFHFGVGLRYDAVFLALEKLAGRWTDELVVINAEDLAAALEHRIVPADRVRLIHGIGVDAVRFDPRAVAPGAAEAVRSELRLGDEPLFVMVAEFTPNKRHDAVLRAFARTASGAHLAFAGDGPTRASAEMLARELGVDGRTHFLGYRTDVRELLAASLATLLFSAREGLPRSSMESLAMGVPVIGADIRGLRELIAEGCGVLVPAGDEAALAAAMDELAANPAGAREMGRLGREKMQGEYSLPAVVAAHERLYEDVLGREPRVV